MTAQEAIKKTLQRTRIHGEENSYRLAMQNVELYHDCRKLASALEATIKQRDNAIRIAYTELRKAPDFHIEYCNQELERIFEEKA